MTAMVLGGVAIMMCGSCRGPNRASSENDRLRFQVIELERELETLRRTNEELRIELQSAAARPDAVSEDVASATPHVTHITIGRLSFARDTAGDGVPDTLTLYIHPADGRGRFVQVAGEINASAFLIAADGDPRRIGSLDLSPADVRDAYRSGITGTHYTVEVPLALSQPPNDSDGLLARVVYRDGRTGQAFTAERMIRLSP